MLFRSNGITVEINRYCSNSNNCDDRYVQLIKGGTVTGSNLFSATRYPTSPATASYGGTSNLWGTTWIYSDLNDSTFGVLYQGNDTTNNNATVYVDYIRVTVSYTASATVLRAPQQVIIQNVLTIIKNVSVKIKAQ